MPRKVAIGNPELDVTQLLQYRPAVNYSAYGDATAQSESGGGDVARIIIYVDSNKYKNLRRVYRANLRARVVNVESSGAYVVEFYQIPLSGNSLKVPTWNQANSTLLWIGGSFVASTKTTVFLGSSLTAQWFDINLIRPTLRAAARKQQWPPAYLLKWEDESVIASVNLSMATDNWVPVSEQTSLQLTLGIQSMRNRPSGMYRGFRRS